MTSNHLSVYAYAGIGYTFGIITALLAVLIHWASRADDQSSIIRDLSNRIDDELERIEGDVRKTIGNLSTAEKCLSAITEILSADKIKIDAVCAHTAKLWDECSELWSEFEPLKDASADMSAVDCPSDCPCRDEDTVDYVEMPGVQPTTQKQFDEVYDRPRPSAVPFDFTDIRL